MISFAQGRSYRCGSDELRGMRSPIENDLVIGCQELFSKEHITAPTQNQTLISLLFLYRHVDLEIGAQSRLRACPLRSAVPQFRRCGLLCLELHLMARMAGYFVVQSDLIRQFNADFVLKMTLYSKRLEGLHQSVLVGGFILLGRHIHH